MTKAELVAVMAKASGGTKASAEKAMQSFLCSVFDTLRRGQRVTISGFGTFVVTRRATRNGRDPRTGQEIKIPAARVPRFKASKALRDGIR
jgi:DNA-binding protein HU-beta